MKVAAFLLALLFLFASTFAQNQLQTAEYYLQKSKDQKTTAWTMLGLGTTFLLVGVITASANTGSDDIAIPDSSGFLIVGGIVTDLISIPVFASSASNARKAATISIQNQQLQPGPVQPPVSFTPAVSLKIRI